MVFVLECLHCREADSSSTLLRVSPIIPAHHTAIIFAGHFAENVLAMFLGRIVTVIISIYLSSVGVGTNQHIEVQDNHNQLEKMHEDRPAAHISKQRTLESRLSFALHP